MNVEVVESRHPSKLVEVVVTIEDVEWICSVSRTRRLSTITIRYWSRKHFLEFKSLENWIRKTAGTGSWLAEELAQYISKYLELMLDTRVQVEIKTRETEKMHAVVRV